ncbi:hypothetical protein HDU67_005054 [Dinochytrium kinnereticum]|nr:hypothetical protein HDU67_005054 [Dinochytrium kinnereticum]
MSSMASTTALIAAAAAVSTVALYNYIVPSDTAPLGNLSAVKREEPAYPEKYWESSNYVQLTHGKTHYFLLGPEDGPKIITIHGITAGWVAMPKFIEGLASKGFRVLAFDLYGRGYSDAPGTIYNEDLYVHQVRELLEKIGWEKCSVIGYSLGGAIATAYAARYSERVVSDPRSQSRSSKERFKEVVGESAPSVKGRGKWSVGVYGYLPGESLRMDVKRFVEVEELSIRNKASKMSTTMGLSIWSIAATSIGLYAIYKWITAVPSDTKDLGNLSNIKTRKTDPPLSQTEDFWPSHHYAHLPTGKTHYHLLGPETGPKLILVHGLTATWPSSPTFVDSLASNGFRVLTYDLYGRGYSASPGVVYDEDLYVNQLCGLLDWVGWSRTHVLGYSLGGAIAVAFAARFPERVGRLALVAPAGLMKRLPIAGRVFAIPVIGKLLIHSFGRRLLVQVSKKNHDPRYINTPELKQFTSVTDLMALRHPGFMRAYLSTIKHGPVKCIDHHYKTVGTVLGDRILCIWGTADRVVNFAEHHETFRALMPKAHVIEMEGRGHSIVPESPKFCVEHVSLFLCS